MNSHVPFRPTQINCSHLAIILFNIVYIIKTAVKLIMENILIYILQSNVHRSKPEACLRFMYISFLLKDTSVE